MADRYIVRREVRREPGARPRRLPWYAVVDRRSGEQVTTGATTRELAQSAADRLNAEEEQARG